MLMYENLDEFEGECDLCRQDIAHNDVVAIVGCEVGDGEIWDPKESDDDDLGLAGCVHDVCWKKMSLDDKKEYLRNYIKTYNFELGIFKGSDEEFLKRQIARIDGDVEESLLRPKIDLDELDTGGQHFEMACVSFSYYVEPSKLHCLRKDCNSRRSHLYDIHSRKDIFGKTALFFRCSNGHYSMVLCKP